MGHRIRFHTNLDEAQGDVSRLADMWPDNIVPRVGEHLKLEFRRDGRRYYELRVVQVRYGVSLEGEHNLSIEVELHLPPHHGSIAEWTTWIRKHRFGKEW